MWSKTKLWEIWGSESVNTSLYVLPVSNYRKQIPSPSLLLFLSPFTSMAFPHHLDPHLHDSKNFRYQSLLLFSFQVLFLKKAPIVQVSIYKTLISRASSTFQGLLRDRRPDFPGIRIRQLCESPWSISASSVYSSM